MFNHINNKDEDDGEDEDDEDDDNDAIQGSTMIQQPGRLMTMTE